ncbi:MAG: bifunctional DNA-formamidopyrimidine glycosylase/DNA-(apurinic or apyrimidinic site) lyase [Alphaproteobacteria bacterium]
MPELPEVETIRRGLEKILPGRRFAAIDVRRPDLRGPIPADLKTTLEGRICRVLLRRGKYIICLLEGGGGFAFHLGMSGRVSILKGGAAYTPAKHDHIIFRLEDGGGFAFNDPRRFGMVFMVNEKNWEFEGPFAAMGPEPLSPEFTVAALLQRLKNRKTPIKVALLDQGVVSGIGNIYASEALYHAGIRPDVPAGQLTTAQAVRLADAVKHVLNLAIAAGGSTLRDYRHADGGLGYFQHQFSVYDQAGQACPDCNCNIAKTGGVVKIQQAARSTFYCPGKQK